MPNTKSAERRVRNSARKQARNKSSKTLLKTLEKKLDQLVKDGKKDEALAAFRAASSGLDKAAKGGVIHRANANRKKSRLATRVSAMK